MKSDSTQERINVLVATIRKQKARTAMLAITTISPTVKETVSLAHEKVNGHISKMLIRLTKDGVIASYDYENETLTINNVNLDISVSKKSISNTLKCTRKALRNNNISIPLEIASMSQFKFCTKINTDGSASRKLYNYLGRQTLRSVKIDMLVFGGNYCVKCDQVNYGEKMTCDHVLPQSKYPQFTQFLMNLQPMCDTCNSDKGSDNTVDHRPAGMKLSLLNRYMYTRGLDLLPQDLSNLQINIITSRIMLKTYREIAIEFKCSPNTISKVLHNYIPTLNQEIINVAASLKTFNREQLSMMFSK